MPRRSWGQQIVRPDGTSISWAHIRQAPPADPDGWQPTYYRTSADSPVHLGSWSWVRRNGENFRRCSGCGSIHPQDLVNMGWDRADPAIGKYPHKFHVYPMTPGSGGVTGGVKFYTQHLADPELDGEIRAELERRLGLRFFFQGGSMRYERPALSA